MQNLHGSLILCFKLINTLSSVSLEARLRKPWHSLVGAENVKAIQKKATTDLLKIRNRYLGDKDTSKVALYLNHIQQLNDVNLKKIEMKGLVRDLGLADYSMVRDFICNISGKHRPFGEMHSAQFECHELLTAIISYLLVKDTIENGSGNSSLDGVIHNLLETKPVSFFEQGYLDDLFICDRLAVAGADKSKPVTIRCCKDYLSTRISEKQMHPDDVKYYDFYKVA